MEKLLQIDTEKLKKLIKEIDSHLGYFGMSKYIADIENEINSNKPISAFKDLQSIEENRAEARKKIKEIADMIGLSGCVLD